jgi:hypothetical protein
MKVIDVKKLREDIRKIKLKTFNDLNESLDNLDDILDEYKLLHKVSKDLVNLKGADLIEALVSQPNDYLFYRTCTNYLKKILDYMESLLRYERAKEAAKIRETKSRASDLNDRAISQLIDGKEYIQDITINVIKVREVYDLHLTIIEAYNQRGYALNNITKARVAEIQNIIL